LSLLMRDEAGYREDLRAAQAWVRRYFVTRAKQTADALAQLKALSSPSLSFEMPGISESLEAVRGFKSRRERGPGGTARDEVRGMRALFWVLAVFAAAVALVILGRPGAGYVMFVYPPYRVELSLPFFVVASLAGFVLLYAAMRLLG